MSRDKDQEAEDIYVNTKKFIRVPTVEELLKQSLDNIKLVRESQHSLVSDTDETWGLLLGIQEDLESLIEAVNRESGLLASDQKL